MPLQCLSIPPSIPPPIRIANRRRLECPDPFSSAVVFRHSPSKRRAESGVVGTSVWPAPFCASGHACRSSAFVVFWVCWFRLRLRVRRRPESYRVAECLHHNFAKDLAMRITITAAAIWLILTSFSAAVRAEDWPIPQDSQKAKLARSEHLAWTRRTLAGAYDKVGKKDPRWDERVNELMKIAVPMIALRENQGTYDDVHQAAKRAIDAGCDDPIVLYIYAQSSFGRNWPGVPEFDRRYATAATALTSSKYPAIRRAIALIRAGHFAAFRMEPSIRADARRRLDTALALFPESFKTDSVTPSMRRVWRSELGLLRESMKLLNGDSKTVFDKIDAVLATVPTAKGIRLYFRGVFYTDYAWEARGSGMASTVTEVGWQKFNERATEARKALEEAWSLDKTDSESAAAMITVEMAIGEGNRDEMEKWFKRAMDADSDNLDACKQKLLWLEPKWHGSPEEMLQFARACRDTKNWRSGIPLVLAEAHDRLAGYLPEAKQVEYMREPDVWQEIHGVYVEYIKNVPEDLVARSAYAAFCYLCSQFKEGHEQFQKLYDQLTPGSQFTAAAARRGEARYRRKDCRRRETGLIPGQGLWCSLCTLRSARKVGRRHQTNATECRQRSTCLHDSGSA